ncbi:MAG: phosphatidate cytidylyltransferase [Acidobacteriota bacterium]|nr:phosphatidate cytidylyltransferase [Acidobacteriota bacterium]
MKRITTALILIPLFVYLVLWSPHLVFLAAVCAVGMLCFHEYSGLVALHTTPPPGIFGYAAGLLVLLLPGNSIAFVILIALFALALGLRASELSETLPFAACLVFGVLYIFGALRAGVELRDHSVYWLLFALSLNWVGDIAALYVGKAFGRHKLSPRISPGKTWEGAAGSMLAAIAYGAVYFPKLLPAVPIAQGLAIAAVGNVAGQIGDLAESAMKRGAGVKDSGTLLPGHGGWLDRLDSSLFALPVVYFLLINLGIH